mmetsp:Transcript_29444/g.69043  ORF Transcript_29444/g.69043 Transcript_29444/m.69043 type:complete len:302 (+) Transcript_29444:214-1119(+)
MDNYCDLTHPKWASQAEEKDGATVPSYIPTITNRRSQKFFILSHIAHAPGVSEDTALELASVVAMTTYHQNYKAVKKNLAKKKGRHVAEYHKRAVAGGRSSNMNPRPDLYPNSPNDLPFHDGSEESKAKFDKLHKLIIQHLINKLGMHPDDEKYAKYYGFLWEVGSGMGLHSDSPTKDDSFRFFLRLIVSVGGSKRINFVAYKFDNDSEVPTKAFNITTVTTKEGADAYLTSPYGNGKIPFCYLDDEKQSGLQAKHEVEVIKPGEKRTANIIIDFPLRTYEDVIGALRVMREEEFSFELEE